MDDRYSNHGKRREKDAKMDKPMMKHEACFHLNEILNEVRDDIQRYRKRIAQPQTEIRDRVSGNVVRTLSEHEIADSKEWELEQLDKCLKREQALEIAACSLTRESPRRPMPLFPRDKVEPLMPATAPLNGGAL